MYTLRYTLFKQKAAKKVGQLQGMFTFRVESGSDDPDNINLGHLFGGSSGSHPQTKLSGCDPDITCSLESTVGI